ncbi:helix-turn-helix domain-containing protein [Paenibacillus sp. FSL H8-0548]|uniref:helix-turn-helix domain-containing protein n=1 Tax=Paenibacillus sp. FSL H8-0548 TaxID=1920422 RepID=UPI0015C3E4F0|nr:helix-turn-helix domain-containing protein [Paenibacillus sp. FSL H8-0548]
MLNESFNLLSLQEAMDILGISRATIDRWRKDKQLPHIKIGKEVWIDKQQLQNWIQLHGIANMQRPSLSGSLNEKIVTIGYQSGAALLWSPLIIKQLGFFEEELLRMSPSIRYQVRWVNAPNGMELVEELLAGRVHIASVGDYPIIASRALSNLLPGFQPQVIAFDGKTSSGGGISLVVPTGSKVDHPEALSSLSVSTVGNSSSSYRLKEWMNTFGLHSEPIIHRGMGDCLNTILEGQVDASMLWEPYLSWVQSIGAGTPLLPEGIGGDYLTGLMTDGKWSRENEPIVIAYLKAHLRAHEFIRNERDRAAELIHQASGFPLLLVHLVLSKIRWDASIYSRDLQTLNRFDEENTNWLSAYKRDSSGLEFRKQFLQEAVEALSLPILPDSPLPGDWSTDHLY